MNVALNNAYWDGKANSKVSLFKCCVKQTWIQIKVELCNRTMLKLKRQICIVNTSPYICPNTFSHTKDNVSYIVSKKWSKCWTREWALACMTQRSLRRYRGPINTVTKIVSFTNREGSVSRLSCVGKLLRRASHLLTRESVARLIRLVHLMINNWTHHLEYDFQCTMRCSSSTCSWSP